MSFQAIRDRLHTVNGMKHVTKEEYRAFNKSAVEDIQTLLKAVDFLTEQMRKVGGDLTLACEGGPYRPLIRQPVYNAREIIAKTLKEVDKMGSGNKTEAV